MARQEELTDDEGVRSMLPDGEHEGEEVRYVLEIYLAEDERWVTLPFHHDRLDGGHLLESPHCDSDLLG
eukprot:3610018-Pyramimonas_sp.AAC.2